MSDMMTFPDTWEEFEKSYGFTDNEEVYTNGARLIPSFRVKQWLDHLPSVQPQKQKGLWIDIKHTFMTKCSVCDWINNDDSSYNFCPNCGSYNGGEQTE